MKKLTRSTTDRMISGVCGGFGEYFDIDPTILRIAMAFIVIFTGLIPGLVFYIVATMIIPKDTETVSHETKHDNHHEKSDSK
ncbi:MAG: PspC domain-containing protein [Candidatus Nomurabacteria bacterium]|nr:PspC domain-containing protein [Candidatus Nomurabacteria bacterium]